MKTIFKLLMIIGLLGLIPNPSFAQSASDSYNKGVALMNKGDYQGAIASFKASMAINNSMMLSAGAKVGWMMNTSRPRIVSLK